MITIRSHAAQETLRRDMAALAGKMPPLPAVKHKVLDYQLSALFALARQYNHRGARFLEIGTGRGGSGFVLSKAAPQATILSLGVSAEEVAGANGLWERTGCSNIVARVGASWDVLAEWDGGELDLVFVDGDHNRIVRDLPWFDRLRSGGLLLCHDYSPPDSRTPSGIVYAELNAMRERLGRPFDVELIDEGKVGMVGFYRRDEAADVAAPEPSPKADAIVDRTTPALVFRGEVAFRAMEEAQRRGLAVTVSEGWRLGPDGFKLPAARTLFVGEGICPPWDILQEGYALLERWDMAAPFSTMLVNGNDALAADIVSADDRERTEALLGDLRVPIYSPGLLLFVRDSPAGRATLNAWLEECQRSTDERIAFLHAMWLVKPLFCALPRTWLAAPEERAALKQPAPKKRRRPSVHPRGRT